MKICVMVNNFGPPWDEGGKNNMREILKRLSAGHEVFVIGIGDCDSRDESMGFPVYQVRSPFYTTRFVRLFYMVGYFRLITAAAPVIQGERPDLIFCYFETASTGFLAYLAKWWAGCRAPLLHTVWSDWYEFSAAPLGAWLTEHLPHLLMNSRWASRFSLSFMDHVLVTSRHLEQRVRSLGLEKVSLTPTGVDTARMRPMRGLREQYEEPIVLGYLGHLSHAKGVSLLLEAVLPILDELDARLLLATTEGAEEDALVGGIDHPRVTCMKLVDPCEFFNRCDFSILPRRRSSGTVSYPNVLLESMACGVPVLTSDLPAIREIIEDSVNGFLFQPNDGEDLRRKIRELAGSPETLRAAGQRARECAECFFDWSHQVKIITAVLAEYVDRDTENPSVESVTRQETRRKLKEPIR